MVYGNRQGRGNGYRNSGCGSGRSGGRGGRNGYNGNNKPKNSNEQKDEMKFCPVQEGKKHVTYSTVVDHIYGIIKKNYKHGNDFVKYLRTGDEDQCGNVPTRKIASQVTPKGDKKENLRPKWNKTVMISNIPMI